MMLTPLYSRLADSSQTAPVIISISLMLFLGFLMTRITKIVKLPNVTAYILTGILIGPYCLRLIPESVVTGMSFISDIALAFIAFCVAEHFRLDALKKNGAKVVLITLFEAGFSSAAVFVLTYFVIRLPLPFAIVLSALASATAPTSTMMTIRQTRAKGDFVDTLLQVIALDDIISLVTYSISISVALSLLGNDRVIDFHTILQPILINSASMILGGLFGVLLKLLFVHRSKDNRLIVSVSVLFAFCGICAVLDISPLLGCMSMGMVYINITDDDKLFKQLNYFSPPFLLLFFVVSGINFRLDALVSSENAIGNTSLLAISVLYFFVRMIGKYGGAWLGCFSVKKSAKVRDYLGLALIPQAGVAIGLAALAARTFGGDIGADLQTIILASSMLYELVGPALAKLSLHLSGSYSEKLEDLVDVEVRDENDEVKTELELLIERIQKIQTELPAHNLDISEEELAFTQAAMEQREYMGGPMARISQRRR